MSGFTLDYIGDAATTRRIIRGRGNIIADSNASNYDPPWTGVHLCGQTDDGQQPTTVARYIMSHDRAVCLHAIAQDVASCGKDEADFVADLCVRGDINHCFYSNRQLWPRAIVAWNEALGYSS